MAADAWNSTGRAAICRLASSNAPLSCTLQDKNIDFRQVGRVWILCNPRAASPSYTANHNYIRGRPLAPKTSGQKTGRVNVKKLKTSAKELTAKDQKKVKGGLASADATARKGWGGQHNETLVRDSTK